MRPDHQDKFVLATALAAALGSIVWFGLWPRRGSEAAPSTAPLSARLPVALPAEAEALTSTKAPVRWNPPQPQRRGAAWIYDVFTPPKIHYDVGTQQFSVATAAADDFEPPREPMQTSDAFGLELIRVTRAVFRLQLIGHVGADDARLGIFENVLTGETIVGGAGRQFDNLDLVVDAFDVKRVPVTLPESMTIHQWVATAIVRERRTGARFTLTDREPTFSEPVVATLAGPDDNGAQIQVSEGDLVRGAAGTFRIGKIRLAPPTVEVTKVGADHLAPEFRLLVVQPAAIAQLPPHSNSLP